jgi:diguanylate cyclase
VLERARLAAELSGAVRRDELHIVYQPVVALDSGDVVALEALVRWKHSSRGPVSPGEFIPIAEEDGQIIGIGDWVLEMACHQLDAWNRLRGDAFPLRMSVNVSGAQLTPSFDRMVRGVLADSGVPPPQLVLEMTERVFVDDPDALRVLQSLREHGVRIAINDFGTGYSSFSYLRRLPLDVLKIDQSFVAEIGEPRNTAVAEAIVTLSNTLELITVAEGIERAEQVETLRAIGCGLGQGYHLARPADAESLTPALIAVQSMQP